MSVTESGRVWDLDWPAVGGKPAASAELKITPGDFFVAEVLSLPGFPQGETLTHPESTASSTNGPEVTGSGEHLCIYLQKTGDNTAFVAEQLAALCECRSYHIGYCGLKDRQAVTRQWFSLPRAGRESEDQAVIRTVSIRWPVLAAHRHRAKLRRGQHEQNRFRIVLASVQGDRERVDEVLCRIQAEGCPNYVVRQRFGHQAGNLDRAVVLGEQRQPMRRRGRNRKPAARDILAFSAARSWLFNVVLAERVSDGTWLQQLAGEPDSDGPTGPLWGDGGTRATQAQGELERRVAERYPELLAVFADTRMTPERRPLGLRPTDLTWCWQDAQRLQLDFSLGPGEYATTVLAECFQLLPETPRRDSQADPKQGILGNETGTQFHDNDQQG